MPAFPSDRALMGTGLDATIDRVERVHTEQLEFVGIYYQQISRWRTEKPTADQTRKLDRMEEQNRQLRAVTMEVLALAGKLRKGSIDRIMGMSENERPRTRPPGAPRRPIFQPALTPPATLRAIRYRALLHGWAFCPNGAASARAGESSPSVSRAWRLPPMHWKNTRNRRRGVGMGI